MAPKSESMSKLVLFSMSLALLLSSFLMVSFLPVLGASNDDDVFLGRFFLTKNAKALSLGGEFCFLLLLFIPMLTSSMMLSSKSDISGGPWSYFFF